MSRLPTFVAGAVAGAIVTAPLTLAASALAPGEYVLGPGTYTLVVPEGATPSPAPTPSAPSPAPSSTATATPSTPSPTATPSSPIPTATPAPTVTPAPTPAPTPTPTSAPTASPTPSTGLERSFPRNPLTPGAVLDTPAEYADFATLTTQDPSRAVVAVADGARVIARITNDGRWTERHSNLGTGRSENYGDTVCSAFGVRADPSLYPWPTQWQLVWQQQQTSSPMISVEAMDAGDADTTRDEWVLRLRSSSGNIDVKLADIEPGRWSYIVACFRLDNTAGWAKAWHAYDRAPDVTAAPTYERTGFDTWQWSGTSSQGHQTLGLYGAASTQVHSLDYSGYGRATTPERAVVLAGLP